MLTTSTAPRRARWSRTRRDRSARRSRAPGRLPAVRSSIVPSATTRPRSTTTARSQRSSTRSSWWRGEQHGRAAAGLADEHLGQRVDGDRVEAGERLVEDEHVGPVEQGADQLDALLVAEREVLELVADPVGEAELARASGSPRRSASARAMPAQLAEEAQLLERPSSSGTGRAPRAGSRSAGGRPGSIGWPSPAHRAGVEGGEPEHGPHRRRLAGAVGPEEPGDRARLRRRTSCRRAPSPGRRCGRGRRPPTRASTL